MTLSAEAISSFKEIYARQFSEQLSDTEVEVKAIAMLRLFRLIYSKAVPKGWQGSEVKENDQRRKN